MLDIDEMMWQKVEVPGAKPLPRYGHSQVVIDDYHVLVIGGCGGPNMVSDLNIATIRTTFISNNSITQKTCSRKYT